MTAIVAHALDPVVPELEKVFTIRAEIDAPLSAGPAPHGERLHIPITGGWTAPGLAVRYCPAARTGR